jgi:hypothetical protein
MCPGATHGRCRRCEGNQGSGMGTKMQQHQEQQRLRIARAVEMAQGSQGGRTSVDAIQMEPEMPHSQIPFSIVEHVLQFPIPLSMPYFFSPSPLFPPMSSSAHLSFPQLNTPMQSTQPSYPMLYYSSPY